MAQSHWRVQKLTSLLARPLTAAVTASLALLPLGCEPDPTDIVRNRTSAALVAYESCDALLTDLKSHLKEEMATHLHIAEQQILANDGWYGGPPVLAGDVAAEADGAGPNTRQEGVDFSGTNNQEQGVDEADFLKTDGYFLYLLNGDELRVLGVPEFGQLTSLGRVFIEGYPSELLIDGDRAVVFSRLYAWDLPPAHPLLSHADNDVDGWYRAHSYTKVSVIDLGADRSAPVVVKELYLEGEYLTGREVEGAVRMASYSHFDVHGLSYWPELSNDFWGLEVFDPNREAEVHAATLEAIAHNNGVIDATTLEDYLPRLFEKSGDAVTPHSFDGESCSNFSISEDGQSRGFTSLLTLDLGSDALGVESDHVMTNWPVLYASGTTLVLAELAQDYWWYWGNEEYDEATNLHRFDISGATTSYTGSGRVPGVVTDQFQIDEHEGQVRVAATEGQWGRWWQQNPPPPMTHLTVLAGTSSLEPVGSVAGLAPGERLWSARFVGEKAYLVTFENIDPLWTIDLSDPSAPTVIGELEVPGVSTYIHPLDGEHLLTIGIGGDQNGLDWSNTRLSLFDVSDFSAPSLASSLNLSPGQSSDGWTYSWSEATYEHKAFQYWGPMEMLAIPLSTYRYHDSGYEFRSKLALVHAAAGDELSVYGEIDHSEFYNEGNDGWWSYRDVRRSVFMGDFIYAISDRAVTAHRLDDLSLTASVTLDGTLGSPWY